MSTTRDDTFGCELFTGRTTKSGYGRDGLRGAHVVAWEAAYGPVPEGFVIDHLCRRRSCVAVHHLEAVTRSENELRKGWGYRVRRKLCAKGHELALHGVVTPEGGKVCRQCNREALEHDTTDGDPGG